MKELSYYINDVRLATDNTDVNGVKDREIVRYFNDGIKSIQAIIFKNNPLCSYFQRPVEFEPVQGTREYTLPDDCYALNAVSRVEAKNDNGKWYAIERAWPEDNFHGWYTANGKLYLTGDDTQEYPNTIRAWYFYRIPRAGLQVGRMTELTNTTATVITNYEAIQPELEKQANKFSIVKYDGEVQQTLDWTLFNNGTQLAYDNNFNPADPALIAINYNLPANKYYLVWGDNTTFVLDLPEEVEPYLLAYVSKRIFGRNNYGAEASKIEMFSQDAKNDIISIFADAGQSIARAPITDTSFLRI